MGLKSRCPQDCVLPRDPRENPFPCFFHFVGIAHLPWPVTPYYFHLIIQYLWGPLFCLPHHLCCFLKNYLVWTISSLEGLIGGVKTKRDISSVQFSSIAQSCPTLCNPMDCSTPGLSVYHQLLEFTQIHVH